MMTYRKLPGDADVSQCVLSTATSCSSSQADPFERINVDYLVNGGTRVSWTLQPWFLQQNSAPYSFVLQVGRTANPDADDWTDVTDTPADNVAMLYDAEKRIYGKTQWMHYRVMVVSANGEPFYSRAVNALHSLAREDWIKYQEVVRKEILNFRLGAGVEGYLLKRRLYGEDCPVCRDYVTDEIRDAECATCYGTGFVGGYFLPAIPCVFIEPPLIVRRDELDGAAGRGTINDVAGFGRTLAVPQMYDEDVWVERRSDVRWMIHKVEITSMIRAVPLTAKVEMRPLPFSHQLYGIEIEGQLVTDP